MSLTPLVADGFEQWCAATTTNAFAPSVSSTMWSPSLGPVGINYGRFGGIGTAGGNNSIGTLQSSIAIPTTISIAGMCFGYRHSVSTLYGTVSFLDAAGNIQVSLSARDNGAIIVNRGAFNGGTTLVVSAPGTISSGAFHHIEFQAKVDPTAGTIDVWVDGVCVVSLNGLNTRGSSVVGSTISSGAIGYYGGQANSIDDFHIYDATSRTGSSGAGTPASCTFEHYGDKRIQTLFPNGAGTGDVGSFTQVGGTGGSPYTAVNDRPENGDTSYVADATAGDIKSFALDDLVAGTTGVVAVFPTACFEKDDATSRSCAVGLRTSSTNAFGPTIGSPSSYAYIQTPMTLDGSGAALSVAGVNGSEILFKVVS